MRISAFTKTYDGRRVLDFPGMALKRGRVYCVIGANGSGKSTLARVTAGVLAPDDRVRVLDGTDVGYMPQRPFAFRMSVRANLLLGAGDRERAGELLRTLQLEHLADKRADRLSGGETARMALARLMMRRHELLILDEPASAMDVETTLLAEDRLRRYLGETSCALMLVTHSLQQARRLADEVLFFHSGRLLEAGDKAELLAHPRQPETRQFFEFYGR